MPGHVTILEGPDGAGKTTLSNYLLAAYSNRSTGSKYVHHGPQTGVKNIAPYYAEALRKSDMRKHNLVSDRSWLSEVPYGKVHRKGVNRVHVHQRRMLERLYLSHSTVLIKCLPPFERCVAAFLARRKQEYLVSISDLRAVYDEYAKLSSSTFYTVTFDYTLQAQKQIKDLVDARRPPANGGPGAGAWLPGESVLILNGRCDYKKNFELSYVPFMDSRLSGAGCSAWLAEQLEGTGVGESKLYWVDVGAAAGDRSVSPEFVNELRPKAIVALGGEASGWCRKHGFRSLDFQHPTEWLAESLQQGDCQKKYPLLAKLRRLVR